MMQIKLIAKTISRREYGLLSNLSAANLAYRDGLISLDKLIETAETAREMWLCNAPHIVEDVRLSVVERAEQ